MENNLVRCTEREMECLAVSLHDLLALMDPDERVRVYSDRPIWCSGDDGLKTAGNHLDDLSDPILNRSVERVWRSVFGYIAIDLMPEVF